MGLLSSSVALTRYKVKGEPLTPLKESIYSGLKKNIIRDIDNKSIDKIIGWTSFENPYVPNFEGNSFFFGSYIIFSLRIDKKSIPLQLIKKFTAIKTADFLEKTGRDFLSTNEKKIIKDEVIDYLNQRIPATPSVYDIVWNYEDKILWFLSNLKSGNEELETLFSKSFNLTLLRLFPYTDAYLMNNLSDSEKDLLTNISSTKFMG